MKELFTEPAEQQLLDDAESAGAGPRGQGVGAPRRSSTRFVRCSIPSAANREDASDSFFKGGGDELMDNLKVDEEDLDAEVAGTGGSASLPLGVGSAAVASGWSGRLDETCSPGSMPRP